MKKSIFALIVLIAALFLLLESVFIVDEREKALVLQFGQIVRVEDEPGLAFKIPIIQQDKTYDDRILSRDMGSLEVTPLDDRRLIVDAFARYRIANVRQFREAIGAGDETTASNRLDSILRAETREVMGSVPSNVILSSDRSSLETRIRDASRGEAEALGLQVIDVRLKRTDLPPENLEKTYERMKAEREREAADEVARGKEAAQRIEAQADRTVVEVRSDAERQAEIIRGEADARRNAIFAEAYGSDPEFFEFYRSMRAYQEGLKGDSTQLILGPDGEFFTYLQSDQKLSETGEGVAE